MGKSKFISGMIIGAIAGGAISLFDRATRNSVLAGCKKTTSDVTSMIKHPKEAIEKVKTMTSNMRTTMEQVSEDVTFIAQKVEELKDVTPQVVGIVKETKEAFTNDDKKVTGMPSVTENKTIVRNFH